MNRPAVSWGLGLVLAVHGSAAFAEIRTEEVEYQQGGNKLLGFLAWDDAVAGKRPGVLVVHEWWGHDQVLDRPARLPRARAAALMPRS
jgi:dienelactone hydrolase